MYKRVKRNYRQTIIATPDKIFPLLCPVKEADWLDDWEYKMIYSESGYAEQGAVFSTPYKDEEDTIWIVTKHDRTNHEVEFARVTPGSRASLLNIKVSLKDKTSSYVDITYTYTAISDSGNKFVDNFTRDNFLKAVRFWEKSMNYYLEKGMKLKKH